jgi:hypothetical protein
MGNYDNLLKWSIRGYLGIFLGYLLFPLFYLMLLAFNTSRIPTHRDFKFTLDWFAAAWNDQRMFDGLYMSILIAVFVVVLSVALGLPGALALTGCRSGQACSTPCWCRRSWRRASCSASPPSSSGASRWACAPPGGRQCWRNPASYPPTAC